MDSTEVICCSKYRSNILKRGSFEKNILKREEHCLYSTWITCSPVLFVDLTHGAHSEFPVASVQHTLLGTNHAPLQVGEEERSEKSEEPKTTLPLRTEDHERLPAYISTRGYQDIFMVISYQFVIQVVVCSSSGDEIL